MLVYREAITVSRSPALSVRSTRAGGRITAAWTEMGERRERRERVKTWKNAWHLALEN
jgi:hypothetical protein